MRKAKKLAAFLVATAMAVSSSLVAPSTYVKAEETTGSETVTQDSWVDPGNYTRGWYDIVSDKDIYGNAGTEDDPYEIKSAKDLAGLAYYSNIATTDSTTTDFGGKYISIISSTIDLGAHYWFPIGTVQNFKGCIDGNGVVIKNMYVGSASGYETCGKVGLFGTIYDDVEDITLKDAQIYSNSTYAGGFVGYWGGGNIENCSVVGNLNQIKSSSNVGGFAGYHTTAGNTIKDCSVVVPVITSSASSHIGGFIGNCSAATTFTNCNTTEDISGGASNNMGGFAGYTTESTYTTCYANGDVISTGNTCDIAGFAAESKGGTYIDCSATGNIVAKTNSQAGGFIGNSTGGTYTDCFAVGNVVAESTSYVGGFLGLSSGTSVYTDCYAKGNVTAGASSYGGGFMGKSELNTNKQCFAVGNVTIGNSGNAGGFAGSVRTDNAYNCYALGNVEAGDSSNVAGFIGYAHNYYSSYGYYNISFNIENCYSAGSVKAGTNSTAAGFFGQRQYPATTITFKKAYWNLSQNQVVNSTYRKNSEKIAVTYTTDRAVVGAYMAYMKSDEFVADLNEYVHQNSTSYDKWFMTEEINNGYPYISGYKSVLVTITGGNKNLELEDADDQVTNSMNVYATLVFPVQETEEPEEPTPEPDTSINVILSWGTLEYTYTAGEYNEETDSYADGTWSPKEEGVSDKITLTNRSTEDVEVSYNFTASTETGIFDDITGTFYQEDGQTEVGSSVPVRKPQGDIESTQSVLLKLSGVPTQQESTTAPEVVGTVLVTVNKYVEPTVEPEEPGTSSAPETDDTTTTEEPEASEDVVTSQEPEVSEDVVTSQEPEASEDVVTSQEPEASEDILVSQEPEVSEDVVTSQAPEVSESAEITSESDAE